MTLAILTTNQLTFEFSVSRRNIEGGTGPESLRQQFVKAKALLAKRER